MKAEPAGIIFQSVSHTGKSPVPKDIMSCAIKEPLVNKKQIEKNVANNVFEFYEV